jgi:hypothetical protein
MPSNNETGHAKNVANFKLLTTYCEGYGSQYNPSKEAIKIASMQSLITAAEAALKSLNDFTTAYNTAVNNRQVAFAPIKPLATRLVNALKVTDANEQTIEDAKGYNRKIQGAKPSDGGSAEPQPEAATTPPTEPGGGGNSTSQQSYSNLVEHLDKLNSLLIAEPSYQPNEADLKTAAITALLTDLRAKNTTANTAETNVSNARISRNAALYTTKTGLFDVAQAAKDYVKSLFGATSPQYKQVSGIAFTEPR